MLAIRYPLQVSEGKIGVTDIYPQVVAQNIVAALQTRTDERVWRPDFGMEEVAFTSIDDLSGPLTEARRAIGLALDTDFPDVEYSTLGYVSDDGVLQLIVRFGCPDYDPEEINFSMA